MGKSRDSKSSKEEAEKISLKSKNEDVAIVVASPDTEQAATPAATPPQKSQFNSFKKGSVKRFNAGYTNTRSFFTAPPTDPDFIMSKKDRDPRDIHNNLKVEFQDVIAEPFGTTSFNSVWGSSYKTYAGSRSCCYKLLSCLFGLPLGLFWGLYFACLAFVNIWVMVPFNKSLFIVMKFVQSVWNMWVSTLLDPLFVSVGKCFSNIRITVAYKDPAKGVNVV